MSEVGVLHFPELQSWFWITSVMLWVASLAAVAVPEQMAVA